MSDEKKGVRGGGGLFWGDSFKRMSMITNIVIF